jgi:hypothetical protein
VLYVGHGCIIGCCIVGLLSFSLYVGALVHWLLGFTLVLGGVVFGLFVYVYCVFKCVSKVYWN